MGTLIIKYLISLNLRTKVYNIGMEAIYRDLSILRMIRAMHDIERIK